MVARLHSLMAGPQAGAAALHQTASRHAGSLTSAATLASAAALALLARHRRNRPYASAARPKRFLHPLAVHAISGAVGEVCQTACLYPLNTIAVKCQAHGTSTRAVLRELRGLGSKRAGMASLYRGLGPSALAAALIGAAYLSAFHLFSEQLVSLSNKVSAARQRRRSSGSGWGGDSPLQLSGGGGSGRAAPAAVPMSATPQLSAINSGQQAVGAAALLQGGARPKNAGRQRAPWQRHQAANLTSEVAAECTGGGGSGRSGSGDLDAACHSRQALQQPSGPDISVSDVQSAGGGGGAHTAAETAAAFLSSITTAFIEGPVELFRHREQAGTCGLGVGRGMAAAFSAGGFGSVFGGYTAFLIKTVPHDVAELITYSRLSAARGGAPAAAGAAAAPLRALQQLPEEAADALIGATAGAASVLVSMPLECIKTIIDTRGGEVARGLGAYAQFWRVGRETAARDGLGSLFRGLTPKMAETVPGCMVYWLAVETCRRALAPYEIQAAPATA